MQTLSQLENYLHTGTSSRSLLEYCLARIHDPAGEGKRVFLSVRESAVAESERYDVLRRNGANLPPFAGIPISIKDMFDIEGDVTTAGSKVLRDAPPACADAPSIARLRAAGFIPIGRTNMTEFAFSGLGINPHYDTPRNPYDRSNHKIPSGSSSGAAVSIADGMAFAALGTDTGGSCRIPAALCGIVGFKPTAKRVPLAGIIPLAPSLDSVGMMAASAACCAALDSILAGECPASLPSISLKDITCAIPREYVFDGIDNAVSQAFDTALSKISAAGVCIRDIAFYELEEMPRINAKGGFPAAEAYAFHRKMIAQKSELYDPRVRMRIKRGAEQSELDYTTLKQARVDLIRRAKRTTMDYDAVLMPTVQMIAPRLSELESDAEYSRNNLLLLRNPTIANFLDRCSISLSCHRSGDAPVGLMLMGPHESDRKLLAIAASIGELISPSTEN